MVMAGPQQPRKRPHPNATSLQHPIEPHDDLTTTPQAAWSHADGEAEALPAKKKLRKSLAGVKVVKALRNFLRDHPWTPSPSTRYEGAVRKKTGPGAPGVTWTRERTVALIRLVVKTDLPFDHIHVALQDPDIDFMPGTLACRRQWERIFHSPPEQARLRCPEARERRYKELKTAYDYYAKHQEALARSSITVDSILSPKLPEIVHTTLCGNIPTPPVSPDEEQNSEVMRKRDQYEELSEIKAESSRVTHATTNSKASSPSNQQPKIVEREPPKTRLDCARRLGLELPELEWVMGVKRKHPVGRVRDSFRSRHSRHYSTDSSILPRRQSTAEVDVPPLPTLFGNASDSDPILCQQLRRAYHHGCEPWTWNELTAEISQSIVNKSVDVTQADKHGITPLHLATAMGYLQVVWLLLAAKADPEALTDQKLSVSAYSRPFARDQRLSLEHIAHIEAAREVVKYNAGLNHIEKHVRVKQGVDAGAQTDAKFHTGPFPMTPVSISEKDVPVCQPPTESPQQSTTQAIQDEIKANSSMTNDSYTDARQTSGFLHGTTSSKHDAILSPQQLSQEQGSDNYLDHTLHDCLEAMHAMPSDNDETNTVVVPINSLNVDTPALDEQPRYGFPLMTSPNNSSSTLIPRYPCYNPAQPRPSHLENNTRLNNEGCSNTLGISELYAMPGPSTFNPTTSFPNHVRPIPASVYNAAKFGMWTPSALDPLNHSSHLLPVCGQDQRPGSGNGNICISPLPAPPCHHQHYETLDMPHQTIQHDAIRLEQSQRAQDLRYHQQRRAIDYQHIPTNALQPSPSIRLLPPQPWARGPTIPQAQRLRNSQSVPAFITFTPPGTQNSNAMPADKHGTFEFNFSHNADPYSSGLPHGSDFFNRQ